MKTQAVKIFRGEYSGQKDQQMQMTRVRGVRSVAASGAKREEE